jgi:hypothetical protein
VTNNPVMNYKPGLTMDEPVAITMAAADWAILMAWFSASDDLDGVRHLVYGMISPQVAEALFSTDSLKAAEAHHAEHSDMPNLAQMMGTVTMNVRSPYPTLDHPVTYPTLDDLTEPGAVELTEIWIIRCGACGSRDEYPGGYDGALTCGHNVGRTVDEKRPIRED